MYLLEGEPGADWLNRAKSCAEILFGSDVADTVVLLLW